MLKKRINYKESGLTLPVYDFRQCFFSSRSPSVSPVVLVLEPKKPQSHTTTK